MEVYEDDDDTHFCIKCHLTVNGLDNYVRHRQSGCRAPEAKPSEVTHEPPSTPTAVTYPEILNADAFFSSLELQSSAKSNPTPRSRTLVDRERKNGRNEDKNKKRARKGQEPDDGGLKDKLLNMPPVVADLDDLMDHLGIPSLVGFPDIVTTTSGKPSTVTSGKLACAPSSTKINNHENLSESPVESIMTNSKGCGERKRNENPQRIDQDHGPWLDDTILVDLDANSESKEGDHVELSNYGDYDYQQDDESDEESPDEDIGEDESSSNYDDPEERQYPPRGHTGGKWKPSELLQDISRLNEDEFVDDEDNHQHQLSLHTGGKWKPADSSHQLQRVEENEVAGKDPGVSSLGPLTMTGRQPPPGHTRGKWIPGGPGDFGSGYWCEPCGRKLASRLLYNRHLLSDLHARRSIQEIDGDLQLPRGVGPLLQRKPSSKRQRALAEIKSRSKIPSQNDVKESRKKSRRRQKEVLVCEMCQARVQRTQMGKHLLSHYHCRVAGANPCSNPEARSFILENMADVVRQCPFQCGICRFYCNTEETFLLHWRSKLHTSKIQHIVGSYKCNPCDFYCDDNETIEQHLVSSGHREIVLMMNRSVPVVIGRQRSIACQTCDQHFRYNLQLRFHTRKTGHGGNFTATDEYQCKIACGLCCQVVRSLVALQRHQLSCHGQEEEIKEDNAKAVVQPGAPYFCSFCMLNFTTANDAVLHRRTSTHKEIVRVQKLSSENFASQARECPHCGAKQCNLMEHKEHLLQHPELCHRCPRCGMLFPLPQDVTRHTKNGECTKPTEEYIDRNMKNNKEWRCTNCPFTTDSRAEFLFHDALHAGSIEENADQAGQSNAPVKYRCPMCEKTFCKVTLRNHIRSHTGERPFRCVKCSVPFSRRSSLNIHRKECLSSLSSSSSSATWSKDVEANASRQRNHVCSECNTGFYTNRSVPRYVTFRETYKKHKWLWFKKIATRIAYRWETSIEWQSVKDCCIGYLKQTRIPLTCSPVCLSRCPHGKCKRPNVCECNSGYRASMVDGLSYCLPNCGGDGKNDDGCGLHGRCIQPATCKCHDGYTPTVKNKLHPTDKLEYITPCIPKCEPECITNAYCNAPNKCQCNAGYRSTSSNRGGSDLECPPICEKKCINGTCVSPNKCRCLSGYKPHPTDNSVCEPICENGCINANCIGPNHCECHQGYKKTPGGPSNQCSPVCDPLCINAICTQPDHCECHQGYKTTPGGPSNQCSPVCDPLCVNAICTQPDHCECHQGYKTTPGGPSNQCSPVCDPLCINAICTQPDHCECHQGYKTTPGAPSNQCSPVCDPLCINAICTQPDHCECHQGYKTTPGGPSNQCSPVCDPLCINAICTQPDHCECHQGYKTTRGGPSNQCSPVCDPLCINAICTQPDHCECHQGYKTTPGAPSNQCSPDCDPLCINAICTQPNHCECHQGYEKDPKDLSQVCLPVCYPSCINGNCTAPNNCECHEGHRKSLDGPSQICSPICDPPCINANCSQPNYCECHRGYKKDFYNRVEMCSPICDPPCVNGTCIQPNQCKCHDGYKKNPTGPSQSCSPVCHPPCGSHASCQSPNECACAIGYIVAPVTNSSLLNSQPISIVNSTTKSLHTSNITAFKNAITCQPLCEPSCTENASCIAPNVCQCDVGYRSDSSPDQITTAIKCLPICEKDCVNGFCGYPNKCICLLGYKPSSFDTFLCEPFCQHDCINANCTRPNYCQCHDGYKKAGFTPVEPDESLIISDNLCIPSHPDKCLNEICVRQNKCICGPSHAHIDTSTDASQQFGQPLCEPNCPIGLVCVAPDQCEPQFGPYQDNNELSTYFPDVVNTTENSSTYENLFNENGTRACKYGWTGSNCGERSFCIIIFTTDDTTDEQFSIVESLVIANNWTDYDESNDENAEEIDWHGPTCKEKCRISILTSESYGNISEEIIRCRHLEGFNTTSDLFSIETQSLLFAGENQSLFFGGENQSIVCFIKAESKCNRLESTMFGYHGAFYGIFGVAILLVIVASLSSTIYLTCRKRRNTIPISGVSMNDSIIKEWPDSTHDTLIESSSI